MGNAPPRNAAVKARNSQVRAVQTASETPRHGYDLIRAIREKGWAGGAGSVYPLLGALEAAGFIAGRDEGERRTYELTEKGRKLLEEPAADIGVFSKMTVRKRARGTGVRKCAIRRRG